jgi:hypothetical protein
MSGLALAGCGYGRVKEKVRIHAEEFTTDVIDERPKTIEQLDSEFGHLDNEA